MIELAELPDALADLQTGELRRQDLYAIVLELLAHHEVAEVFAYLPPELQGAFDASLRESFDNETPPDEIIWIDSGRGEHPAKAVIVVRARRWFAAGQPPSDGTSEQELADLE